MEKSVEFKIGSYLIAGLVSLAVVCLTLVAFQSHIKAWLKDAVQPQVNVKTEPIDETSLGNSIAERLAERLKDFHKGRRLKDLTAAEWSQYCESETTAWIRLYNHYLAKKESGVRDPKMFSLLKQQHEYLGQIYAAAEEAKVKEMRELGQKANNYTPLTNLIDDQMDEIQEDK